MEKTSSDLRSTLHGAKSAFASAASPARRSVTPSPVHRVSVATPPARMGANGRPIVASGAAQSDWDVALGYLKSYGVPLAAVALCGAGAVYLSKRMSDLETKVAAGRRNDVRHLSENDVRLIIQQMAKDGLINIPQTQSVEAQQLQEKVALLEAQKQELLLQQQQYQQYYQQQVYIQRQQQEAAQQQQQQSQQQEATPVADQRPAEEVASTPWTPKAAQ